MFTTKRKPPEMDQPVVFEQIVEILSLPNECQRQRQLENVDWAHVFAMTLQPHMIEYLVSDKETREYVRWDLVSQHEGLTGDVMKAFIRADEPLDYDHVAENTNFTCDVFDELMADPAAVAIMDARSLGPDAEPKFPIFRSQFVTKRASMTPKVEQILEENTSGATSGQQEIKAPENTKVKEDFNGGAEQKPKLLVSDSNDAERARITKVEQQLHKYAHRGSDTIWKFIDENPDIDPYIVDIICASSYLTWIEIEKMLLRKMPVNWKLLSMSSGLNEWQMIRLLLLGYPLDRNLLLTNPNLKSDECRDFIKMFVYTK